MMTTNPPLFSIITITFNNRGGLARTAQSLQHLDFQDYEWIIIDGASTDGTQDDFIHYPNARIISEPDTGIYDAMNKGIGTATGDYLIFMNAGDAFASINVLNTIAPLTTYNPDFIYGDSIEDSHLKKARSHTKIDWGMFTHHQAMFYKRETLGSLRYNGAYKIAADYDLTLRFLKLAKNILYTPTPICIFETGGVSQTHAKQGRDEQFMARAQNRSCTIIVNHCIRLIQILRYFIRQHAPAIYWKLNKF